MATRSKVKPLNKTPEQIRAEIRADDVARAAKRKAQNAAKHYTVKTRDVDGTSTKKFSTFKAARQRFEEMSGHTMEAAIEEMYHSMDVKPDAETVRRLESISNYGTVVMFFNMTPAEDEHPTLEEMEVSERAKAEDEAAAQAAEFRAALVIDAKAVHGEDATQEVIDAYVADQLGESTPTTKVHYTGPMLILRERAKVYVRGIHCGDPLADLLDGLDRDAVIRILGKILLDAGITSTLNPYTHLNAGQQSMNLRNRFRSALKNNLVTLASLALVVTASKG